jgi:hypothetical protein
MPDTLRSRGHLFRLNGVAVYRKFGIKVLTAGLWLDHRERNPATILRSDLPRRYVTHFYHEVSANRIREEWKKGLEANTPNATPTVRAQFRTLYGWIRDFSPGDEITVTYLPGEGSLVEIQGTDRGLLPGKGFADAYFGCALGPKPRPSPSFRRRLLGG